MNDEDDVLQRWAAARIERCEWAAEIPATCALVEAVAAEADRYELGSDQRRELRQALEDIIDTRLRHGDQNPLVNKEFGIWDREWWFEKSERDKAYETWHSLALHAPDCATVRNYPTPEGFWAVLELDDVHMCGDSESLTARLLLALHTGDDDAYQVFCDDLSDCPDCWCGIAKRALNLLSDLRQLETQET
ncbi:hypothetical protein A5647_24180 [Mycobacterium sp. 1100029.7]|nr:hypothetical protein A5647_24180 [Mycobacterium sp. 1100029.7]